MQLIRLLISLSINKYFKMKIIISISFFIMLSSSLFSQEKRTYSFNNIEGDILEHLAKENGGFSSVQAMYILEINGATTISGGEELGVPQSTSDDVLVSSKKLQNHAIVLLDSNELQIAILKTGITTSTEAKYIAIVNESNSIVSKVKLK